MKICVLGNSHLAAFKLGWEKIAGDYPDVSVDCFGLGRNTFRHTELKDGAIVPTKPELVEKMKLFSGGHASIPVAKYDAFVVVGLLAGMIRLMRYLPGHGIAGEMEDRPQIVSYEMMQDAWDEYVNSTPMPHLIGLLREVSDAPILHFMRPLRSSAILDEDNTRAQFFRSMAASGDMPYANALLARLMEPHLNGHMIAIPQPEETTVGGVLTDKRYSVGSTLLRDEGTEHGDDDVSHMNADYGAVCMAQALETLGLEAQARSTITEPTE